MHLWLLSTAQEERWQPTFYISQRFCCPGIITNTGRMLRFSRFRTKLYNNSISEYLNHAQFKVESNEIQQCSEKTTNNTTQDQQSEGTSSKEDQDPKLKCACA